MEIDAVVVILAHVCRIESLVFKGIGGHYACCNRFLDLLVELLGAAYADFFLAVFGTPDRERRAPETAAAEVPVLDVLKPNAEASGAGGFRLPADLLVQGYHLVFDGGGADEPGIKRIIYYRAVGTPAVRIAVNMLLHAEQASVLLHHHAKVHVEHGSILGEGLLTVKLAEIIVYRILYVAAGELLVGRIHRRGDVCRIEVFQTHETPLSVHLRHGVSVDVDGHHAGDSGGRSHPLVVGAECRGDMHYAGTVLGRHIVAGDDAEGVSVGFEPGNQLLVAYADEFRALERTGKHLVGYLVVEPRAYKLLGEHVGGLLPGILVGGGHSHVFDARAHAERGVRRKSPGGGGPGQEVYGILAEELFGCSIADHLELHGRGRVGHIAVASRLVELMGAEAGAVRRAVGLDCVSLVKKALVVDLLEEEPQSLDITVVVGYVRIVQVHPVAHAFGHVGPLLGVLHHLLTASAVVFFDGYFRSDVGLGNAQFLLHSEFDGQSVCVPACATAHFPACLALVAADRVLDGTGHHMMYARLSVCRRRTFKEDELRLPFREFETLLEGLEFFPTLQHTVSRGNQIQSFIFFECHIFYLNLYCLNNLQI